MRTSPAIARVGMIGAGWVTQFHLPAWEKQAARARVVAIADPDPAAARQRAERSGIARVYNSAEAMLVGEELDVIDICAPREAHAGLVRLAASKGLAIMCQKPLAPTLAEAKALVSEISPSVRLMVHENWRFRPVYRQLKAWLDEGLAGKIRRVELDFLSGGMIEDATGHRAALERQPFFKKLPRMLVSEILIHHLDALRYVLGELDLVASSLERTNSDLVGEDIASLTLRRRSDGIPVDVMGNLAVHGEPPVPFDRVRIMGERGTLAFDGRLLTAVGTVTRTVEIDPAVNYQQSYDDAIGHFLDALSAGTPFETAPEDNLNTLALVEAAYVEGQFRDTSDLR